MNKTGFTKLLAKKINGNCKFCQENMEGIVEAMKKGGRINLFLEPEKNTHGILIYWHINLVPKDKIKD